MSIQQQPTRHFKIGGCSEDFYVSLLLSAVIHGFILLAAAPWSQSQSSTDFPSSKSQNLIHVSLVDHPSNATQLDGITNVETTSPLPITLYIPSTEAQPSLAHNDSIIITPNVKPNQKNNEGKSAMPIGRPATLIQKTSPASQTDNQSETEYGTPDRKPKPINLQIPIAPSTLDDYIDSTALIAKVNIDFEGKPLRVSLTQMADGAPALPRNFIEIIEKILLATKYKHAMKSGYPSDDIFELEISISSGRVIFSPEQSIQLDAKTMDLVPTDAVMRRR